MMILYNKIYRDMTDEEISEINNIEQLNEPEPKDDLTTLAEGLSTATSLAQVRSSAKAVLGDASNES